MSGFEILPAIDVKGGKAVRLVRGELSTETQYGEPVQVAQEFAAAGARWIHLVDLDAAFGQGSNFPLIKKVIESIDVKIELSGGIRNEDSLIKALSTGCNRINLGTAALENPEWSEDVIARFGDKVAVGLDVKGQKLSSRGWTKSGGDLFETIDRLDKAGCSRYVVTDISRDGTLIGPNLDLLRQITKFTSTPIIASGGVSSIQDVKSVSALSESGVEGVIIGKALYAGAFTLREALALAHGSK
ncbi:MAG: bifunctional 1-(5-phosphoribosyl)-5-((5-phosphoribosylamino)methylideneamino)imidazole-4-carboxamide isomerase/phosphoribosylanthranilate isomerase PriA [Actinobacteria bacterium]|nr:bifunctional 1-(5-phosphoribosyl)-5-((5-phosphoribosylamino)methylideneamino)imidazole-4-carboxamide isomerase/phosphoribosylanthranilate isomerase PriA [Actinomycetota bacterium]